MNKHRQTTRRRFLQQAASVGTAIALPTFVPASAQGLDGAAAPSERITLGVIGYGPRCEYDLPAFLDMPDVQSVGLADVQATRRAAGKQRVDAHYGNGDCAVYRDFRELLDRDDIDAVLIATGDRWHASASMMAAEAGKDVYSEKPCGMTIDLCQQLADAFDRTKRVFQAGTQRRSVPNFQQAVELAHGGKLGKLHTLHASVYRPAINTSWLPGELPPPVEEVDWNLWLGPVSWRPYNCQYVAGGWRGLFDFDSGAKLLDWGAHTVDLCQWANQADETLPIDYEPAADRITAHYANGVQLVMHFLDTPFGERPGWVQDLGTCPVRFEGEAGSVEVGDSGGIVVKPAALAGTLSEQAKKIRGLDVAAHARDFIDCVKSRGLPRANQHVMRRSHIACHAAAAAWILQRKLTIDPKSERFVDDLEANMLISRPARDPWIV
jgi:predicted dehydrogenase